jgi:phospholipase C
VPTQTNPNRAFSLIGTSMGNENNAHLNAVEQYDHETIFNALGTKKSWGLYYHDLWAAPEGSNVKQCFTQYTFPRISDAPNGEIATLQQFYKLAQSGNLPEFTYLEPQWGYGYYSGLEFFVQGWDYHPPTLVHPGENFLLSVYNTLRFSKKWDETLLIVTFDEHGGTFDHVAPAWKAINPDDKIGTQGFGFNMFGARVPTLLISPYIKPATVFRAQGDMPFDHTSFIKTLLGWAGIDYRGADFGKRMPNAPTFDGVLSKTIVNTEDLSDIEPEECELPPNEIGALFEGVGFAAVRSILRRKKTLEEIQAEIARYHADPAKFEAELRSGVS